jgi:diadenosine tetraphosphatase ApaH/serine/threonine PP2A family protein phosphatase
MIKDAGAVDGYISLGDNVNYGPWSNECIDLLHSLPHLTVLEGNHERDFLKGGYSGRNLVARTFFDFCYPRFDRFTQISGLREDHRLNGFTFVHTIRNQYVYPDSEITLDGSYVVGHSHYQFKISQEPYVLYNPGSVGQNRQYINVIDYLTLETATMKFEMHKVKYDERLIIGEMKRQGYPEPCIRYYDDKLRF